MKISEAYKIIGGLCGHGNRKAEYLYLFKFNFNSDPGLDAYPACRECAIRWQKEICQFKKQITITPELEFALKLNFYPLGNGNSNARRLLVAKFARSFVSKKRNDKEVK